MSTFEVIVFPGQGSQKPGMGLDFVNDYKDAKDIFAQAAEILNLDILQICKGEDGRIHLTEFTQPTILVVEIAILKVVQNHFHIKPKWFGGHSLGEYTALVASGAMPFEVALPLVQLRGKLMQSAVPVGVGKMVALIMEQLPIEEIKKAAEKAGIDIANDNSPAQLVMSGPAEKVDSFLADFRKYETEGTMRIIPLETSAPFHSRMMNGISLQFRKALVEVQKNLNSGKAANVVSNWSGKFHSGDLNDLIESLVQQISSTVRWQENMKALLEKSNTILEIGPERTLRTFFYKIGVNVPYLTDVRLIPKVFKT